MKFLGQTIIWIAVGVGVISAATAYQADLSLPDDQLIGLTLGAPAGAKVGEDDKLEPIAKTDTKLDAQLIQSLRDQPAELMIKDETRKVEFSSVRVKEFAWSRWSGRWYFLLSLAVLVGGAFLTRRAAKLAAAVADHDQPEGATGSPEALLDAVHDAVQELAAAVEKAAGHDEQKSLILDHIGQLQKGDLARFYESRDRLIAQKGLGYYAELMDRFALAERHLNRAWSAAADDHTEEALASLKIATEEFAAVFHPA